MPHMKACSKSGACQESGSRDVTIALIDRERSLELTWPENRRENGWVLVCRTAIDAPSRPPRRGLIFPRDPARMVSSIDGTSSIVRRCLPRRSASSMASFNPQDYGFDDPPPRPTTPPVRRGFLVVLSVLCLAAVVVYGVLYIAERISYAWESGRARADSEALAKLDKEGIVNRASVLFRMATNAVSPAVVNVQSFRRRRGGDGFAGMPVGEIACRRGCKEPSWARA